MKDYEVTVTLYMSVPDDDIMEVVDSQVCNRREKRRMLECNDYLEDISDNLMTEELYGEIRKKIENISPYIDDVDILKVK